MPSSIHGAAHHRRNWLCIRPDCACEPDVLDAPRSIGTAWPAPFGHRQRGGNHSSRAAKVKSDAVQADSTWALDRKLRICRDCFSSGER